MIHHQNYLFCHLSSLREQSLSSQLHQLPLIVLQFCTGLLSAAYVERGASSWLNFILSQALSCPHGAFPIIQHSEVQDLTASLMTEVCHDVHVEPHLHALSGEALHHRSAVLDDNARVDIRASGF